ncbi:MAG: autotransporter-associated beta strand repeat-containing protein, partial [Verrucomicrobia bacterium]|nr:autotransporter-associated beta strand repeat-containing protein [Verrucomicrobiota bacterium]
TINGSLAGAVALNSAVAKLGGSGTINGSVTNVGGSQILPGDSGAKGTLTVTGDLVLNGGSLVYEINDNDNADKIVVGGNLAVNAATVLNVTQPGFPYLTNGDYALMEVTGAFGGTNNFSLALTPSPPPSKVFSLVFDAASAPKKVILRVAPGSTADLSWVGGSGGNVWNNSTANWTNALNGGPLVAFTPAAIATFDSTGSANPLVNISAAVAPATVTVNAATDYAFFGAGGITGTNSLTKIGAGTLTISNANSFTGVVNLNEGTLLVANAAALGATNGLVSVGLDIATNATLALAGGITVGAKPLALRGDGAVAGTGALRNLGGTNIWGGDVTLTTSIATRIVSDAGKLVIAGNVTNGGSGALLLGGAGAGEIGGKISGAGGVSKSATGTWTLSGANNYSGATSVSSGVLALTGSLTNTANVTVDGGAFANAGVLNAGTAALFTGTAASSRGIINLTAGSITVNNAEAGLVATASGALNVSGGTFTTTQAAIGEDNFRIGKVGYGAFTLSGGTVNVQRFQSQGGTGATGIALVSGGTLNVTEVLTVGRNGAAGGQGVLTVSGGTVNHANATGAINVGNASGVRGEVNLIGGIINNSGQTISFGAGSGTASGIVNLDAGTLITGSFLSLDGVNAVNFGGATLQAAANTAVFLPATLPAYINGPFGAFAGGAVIDTAGFNVTNAASLLTPVGNGVSGISLATEGSDYIGAPYVAIAGDGSGATAIAEMTTDGTGDGTLKVAVIRITNPGINYSTAPTVTLSGGAPTAAAAIGTVTLAANTSGGLVKLGAGALTLAGANTYTGATTVSNGTLQIAGSLAGGGVAVQSGGTLGGGGSIGGPVTVASGAALAPDANAITTLTLNSNLTLAAGSGTFLKVDQANGTNDVVAGLTNVIFGGTLTVTNLGGT